MDNTDRPTDQRGAPDEGQPPPSGPNSGGSRRDHRPGVDWENLVPGDSRHEAIHASSRSIYLAGFILTFLGLLLNIEGDNMQRLLKPAAALLSSFILFLGVSEYLRAAATIKAAERGEYAYIVASIVLVGTTVYTFFTLFPSLELTSLPAGSVLGLAGVFVLLKSWHLWRALSSRHP